MISFTVSIISLFLTVNLLSPLDWCLVHSRFPSFGVLRIMCIIISIISSFHFPFLSNTSCFLGSVFRHFKRLSLAISPLTNCKSLNAFQLSTCVSMLISLCFESHSCSLLLVQNGEISFIDCFLFFQSLAVVFPCLQ